MNSWLVFSIGFLAQGLFSSRLIVQWLVSEKQQKVITPTIFWLLSLAGSIVLFIYGFLRNDFAIMLGQFLTYFIYIRNLHIQKRWSTYPLVVRSILIALPILLLIYFLGNNTINLATLLNRETLPLWLLLLGVFSQLVFTFRFIVQWLYSEKHNTSILPLSFWILSLIGAILILIYALFRMDWVLLIAHSFGAFIYIRNIQFSYTTRLK